jgi:hypothetical protein
MSKMTPEEIEQHDKRQSAVHEAGHAVVAFTYGVIVGAWLERTNTTDPIWKKTWVGHIPNVYGSIGAGKRPVLGIAGVVAECLEKDPEVFAEEIVDDLEDGIISPSPSDLLFMPASWPKRVKAVKVALGILSQHKAVRASVASELVAHGLVTADRMAMLAAEHGLVTADSHVTSQYTPAWVSTRRRSGPARRASG